MKRRIKAGDYVFPENEWAGVSAEAKDLIKEMLLTTPEKRATIEQILKSRWISVSSLSRLAWLLSIREFNLAVLLAF